MSYYKPYYKDKTGAIKELPIDASTLGGLPPSDYAKTSDISFVDIGEFYETIINGMESATQGLLKIVDTAVSYNYATHVKGTSDGGCDPFITLLDYSCSEGTYIGGTSIIRFYFAPSYEDDQGNLRDGTIEIINVDTYTKDEVDAKINDVVEIAEGKTKTYVLSYNETIETLKEKLTISTGHKVYDADGNDITDDVKNGDYDSYNIANNIFNSNSNIAYTVDGYLITLNYIEGNNQHGIYGSSYAILPLPHTKKVFKTGDILYIIETNVPDRWYGGGTTPAMFFNLDTLKGEVITITDMSELDTYTTPGIYRINLNNSNLFHLYVDTFANGNVVNQTCIYASYYARRTFNVGATGVQWGTYYYNINGRTLYTSGTTYDSGSIVYHYSDTYSGLWLCIQTTTQEPSLDSTNWKPLDFNAYIKNGSNDNDVNIIVAEENGNGSMLYAGKTQAGLNNISSDGDSYINLSGGCADIYSDNDMSFNSGGNFLFNDMTPMLNTESKPTTDFKAQYNTFYFYNRTAQVKAFLGSDEIVMRNQVNGESSIMLKYGDVTINDKSFNELYRQVQEMYRSYTFFTTDNSIGYSKIVPNNVEQYATVNKIGGISKASENLISFSDAPNIAINGINYSIRNGTIKMTGTTTYELTIDLPIKPINLEKGQRYDFTFENTVDVIMGLYLLDEDNQLIKWSTTYAGLQANLKNAHPQKTCKACKFRIAIHEADITFSQYMIKPMLIAKNKNLWDFADVPETVGSKGITYSCTDGVIKLSGTATSQVDISFELNTPITLYGGVYNIELGNKLSDTWSDFIKIHNNNTIITKPNVGQTNAYCQNSATDTLWLTNKTTTITKIVVWLANGTSIDTELTPMLFQSQRNLMALTTNWTETKNGITCTVAGGRVILNGTTTAATEFKLDGPLIQPGRYQYNTVYTSGTTTGTLNTNFFSYGRDTLDWSNQIQMQKGTKVTTQKINNINLYINSGVTFTDYVICPCLYEPYVAPIWHEGYDGIKDAAITEVQSIGTNILKGMKLLGNGYIGAYDGELTATTVSKMYDYFPVTGRGEILVSLGPSYTNTTNAYTNRLGFYNEDKVMTGWYSITDANIYQTYTIPNGTKYIRVSIDNNAPEAYISFGEYRRNAIRLASGYVNTEQGQFGKVQANKTYTFSARYDTVKYTTKSVTVRIVADQYGSGSNLGEVGTLSLLNHTRASITFTAHADGYIGLNGSGFDADDRITEITLNEGTEDLGFNDFSYSSISLAPLIENTNIGNLMSGITFELGQINDDGTLSGTSSGEGYSGRTVQYIPVRSSTSYVYKDIRTLTSSQNTIMYIVEYDSAKNFIQKRLHQKSLNNMVYTTTFTTTEKTAYVKFGYILEYKLTNAPTMCTLVASNTLYKLSYYGLGIDETCYNYIDLDNNKYVQKVSTYSIVDTDIHVDQIGTTGLYRISCYGVKGLIKNNTSPRISNVKIYLQGFKTVSAEDTYLYIDGVSVDTAGAIRIFRHDIQTLEKAKELLAGKTIIYELAEPVITSLTYEYDNIIEVEPNGTIIFENEHQYDVPNEIEYQVKAGN